MRKLLPLLAAIALVGVLAGPASAVNQSPCLGLETALATITMPNDYWAPGPHSYQARFVYDNGAYVEEMPAIEFTVAEAAPAFDGPIFLRYNMLSTTPGPPTDAGTAIRPGQPTIFYGGHLLFIGWDFATRLEARAFWSTAGIEFRWDGGEWVAASKLPVTSACAGGFSTIPNDMLHVQGQLSRHYE